MSEQADMAMWAAEVLDHWADQEDASAISCHPAGVEMHREREGAYRDGAQRFRHLATPPEAKP